MAARVVSRSWRSDGKAVDLLGSDIGYFRLPGRHQQSDPKQFRWIDTGARDYFVGRSGSGNRSFFKLCKRSSRFPKRHERARASLVFSLKSPRWP